MLVRILAGALTISVLPSLQAQEAVFTTGPAKEINAGLLECGRGSRPSAVGEIASDDGTIWTVPAATRFDTALKATDLFNECGGERLSSLSQLDLDQVPLLDAGGDEEFAAYIFADNYFEFYIDGELMAIDPVPFTPFNSNVIRFKAERPFTIAVKLVDWEENLGLGSESNRGSAYHPGDGGFVAHIQDADNKTVAITDANWRAQTFYTAPLQTRDCLVVVGQNRDSSACDQDSVSDANSFSAAHWPLPEDWMAPSFDDSSWPAASVYSNQTVGVDNKKSYTNFRDVFDTEGADAGFIWSSNLVLDNLVIVRTTVD